MTRSHLDLRSDQRLPVSGTKNWQLLPQQTGKIYSPRHSHATTVFKCPDRPKQCLWLTGGYSESHRSFDLRTENENCDVWYSKDGEEWNQVGLYGDFIQGVGNWDAKPGGLAAPWYARYGHSLNALDADGDDIADVMVLAGGNSPVPSNDVWLSTDGSHWYFDGYAEWPKRAYHSTAVFQGKLFILGGTPLSNNVWAGSLVKNNTREVGYTIKWDQMKDAPWTPRVGACAVAHSFDNTDGSSLSNNTEALANTTEALFILGGLAGYSEEHPDYDGIRARNDVWKTTDGDSWERVMTDTKVPARAFFGCTSWRSNNNDPTSKSKMFIAGGGYMGIDGNREVRSLETYTDTWWSNNGKEWFKVNYEEGTNHKDNLYSTNEWTEITVEGGRKVYRGKWGFTFEAFFTSQDLDGDGEIKSEPALMKACSANKTICKTLLLTEEEIPALYLIGGKVEGFSMVSDTFVSKQGIHCELDGITCGERGTCGVTGCICHSSNFTGEYCMDKKVNAQASSAPKAITCSAPIATIAIGLLAFGRGW